MFDDIDNAIKKTVAEQEKLKNDKFYFEDAGQKLPVEDTASEYFVSRDKNGNYITKLPQDLTDAEMKAAAAGMSTVSPIISYSNGKVRISGGENAINSDVVRTTMKTIQDYYKGKDLENPQVQENFQTTLEEANKQMQAYFKNQEYNNFLKSNGFSDEAYRNYALAAQDADPDNTTNLLKSTNKYKGKKKDGKFATMTASDWINYWKKEYNPEDRAQLWMDAADALARATEEGGDDNLYAALPYILMGHSETINAPAALLNQLNIFDEGNDTERAKVITPTRGFEDTNDWSVFAQAFIRQLAAAGLSTASLVTDAYTNPWLDLGSPTGGQYFGIDDWKDEYLEEWTREDFQDYAKMGHYAVEEEGLDTYEKIKEEYGDSTARKMWIAYSMSKVDPRAVGDGKVLDTIKDENGEVVAEEGDYPGYTTYKDFQKKVSDWRENVGGFEPWAEANIDEMNKYIQRMSVYSPNAATAGIVTGKIASFIAEQAALSLISGGALSASSIADRLARGGYRFLSGMGKTTASIKLGQEILSKAPKVAQVLSSLAQGGEKGWKAAKGLDAASKIIYAVGEIGTWAVKEVGEDALRGLVDDTIMKNSFDSQGNLDPDKFIENVYMNAVMSAMGHAVKGATKGLAAVVNLASTRDIDGVELNMSQRHQLDLFQKALDDQRRSYQFRGWDEDGHPVITAFGKTKVLDQLTPSDGTVKAINEVAGSVTPTANKAIEDIMSDEDLPNQTKQKIAEAVEEQRVDGGDIKTKLESKLTDDEIREAFPDGTVKIGDQTIKIDTKEFTAGDINRVSGKEFSNMDEAIEGLKTATRTGDFASSINAIFRHSVDEAKDIKQKIDAFADAHNMAERDVMVAIRDSRLAGEETVPGLQQLFDETYKPLQDKFLDVEEQLTGYRPAQHNFYTRDMLAGTFKPGSNGTYTIDRGSIVDTLGGDSEFDLSASSTARNTGKLGEMAADKLEYDPEVLAREYVASRLNAIWGSDDMGKVFATLQEAHDAGEYNLTEADAMKSVAATEKVATEVEYSEGVQTIQDMTNVDVLDSDFGKEFTDAMDEAGQKAELKEIAETNKKSILDAQRKFNNSAKKSNAAELISKSSGYSNRGSHVEPTRPPIGVNYMPGNPFGPLAKMVNDNYIKGNSIVMEFNGYKADGSPVKMRVSAYNGGYKMWAEAGSFARNVIVDIENGESMWDAVNKQLYNNGFFIEPSSSQIRRYGALRVKDQVAKATDKIMDNINDSELFSHVFNDDGTVKSTEGLISLLTKEFMRRGTGDFMKFIKKANLDSFPKGQKEWLNARAYEMTAALNKNTFKKITDGLMRASMALRYDSHMYFNYKNGQLQLTENQRAFTMNKLGDFGSMLKRLVSDSEFRSKASDYAYILASDSAGAGFSKSELDKSTDAFTKLGAASVFSKEGILTNIDTVKEKFGDFNDAALASIHGAEYAKNYFLIAGFVAAGERQGLSGVELDNYVRNRFNVEALAGTKVGKIGLTDSRIGQFTFMYLGFPIRDLTLQVHTLKGGGTIGGKGWKKFVGAADYLGKMLGAKGLMWAIEAPWGYSLMDQLNLDPFGIMEQYDAISTPYEDREPGWRVIDYLVKYNPLLQGAMTNTVADIYMKYRAAEEEARAEYMKDHDGSAEGFQWSIFQDGAENFNDIMKGLEPVGNAALGYIPGYTAASRIEGEISDLDRGYRISKSGNTLYEVNQDPANIFWGMFTGRKNTTNAQEYYQTPNPLRGLAENGLEGLGQQINRAREFRIDKLLDGKDPFRKFREFDPVDTDTYEDWFNGTYQDQQNWNTGIYSFRQEAQDIKSKYDKRAESGTAVNDMAARENELADLRTRVEAYVDAYMSKHPEGIGISKQNQLINIFNLGGFQKSLDESFEESQGEYSDEWDKAEARYMQGDFPTATGFKQDKEGNISFAQSPQLEQVLSQQRYGIASEVAPIIEQMYKKQQYTTPMGKMTMKEYHDRVYEQLQAEWNKAKTDYNKVTKIQENYLDYIAKNVIEPVLNTYGSSVLSAGRSSDIMQAFGSMLYSMIPSDDYRIDKKGKKIYKSTPYMTVDIPAWLRKNFSKYQKSINVTTRDTANRLNGIQISLDNGRKSTAKAKARALIQDIGKGKASVSRDELEWLQEILND